MRERSTSLVFFLVLSAVLHLVVLYAAPVGLSRGTLGARASKAVVVLALVGSNGVKDAGAQQSEVRGMPVPAMPGAADQTDAERGAGAETDSLLEIPLDQYLPPSLLTERPYPKDHIDPTPGGVRLAGVLGKAELMLLISSDGDVDYVVVIDNSLPEAVLAHAVDTFRNSVFLPGKINGQTVRSRVRVVLDIAKPGPDELAGNPMSAKQIREANMRLGNEEIAR